MLDEINGLKLIRWNNVYFIKVLYFSNRALYENHQITIDVLQAYLISQYAANLCAHLFLMYQETLC